MSKKLISDEVAEYCKNELLEAHGEGYRYGKFETGVLFLTFLDKEKGLVTISSNVTNEIKEFIEHLYGRIKKLEG